MSFPRGVTGTANGGPPGRVRHGGAPHRRALFSICLEVVALGVWACHSPTQVQDAPGRFALVAVNGKSLPAMVDTSALEYGVVFADTIALDGRGGATRALVVRRVLAWLGRDDLSRRQFVEEYRRAPGARIEIGSFTPCPPNALCVGNDVGVEVAEGLALTTRFYGDGHLRLRFVRLKE